MRWKDFSPLGKKIYVAIMAVCLTVILVGGIMLISMPKIQTTSSNGYYCTSCKTDYSDHPKATKDRNGKYISRTNLCESCYKALAAIKVNSGEWDIKDVYTP